MDVFDEAEERQVKGDLLVYVRVEKRDGSMTDGIWNDEEWLNDLEDPGFVEHLRDMMIEIRDDDPGPPSNTGRVFIPKEPK